MVPLPRQYTLGEMAALIGCQFDGDQKLRIDCVGKSSTSRAGMLCYTQQPKDGNIKGVVIASEACGSADATLIVNNPRDTMRELLIELFPEPAIEFGIHPTAQIDPSVKLPEQVYVGPYAIISEGVSLSDGVTIASHAVINAGVSIGQDTEIGAHVFIERKVRIGSRCKISPHAVIGTKGFGYDRVGDGWQLFPQVASVVVGDDVHIGPHTIVDRGALNDTDIGRGVIIDGHCVIGHGVSIGEHCLFVAMTCIAGSTFVGRNCLMGGNVVVNSHLNICDNVQLAGGSTVLQDVIAPGAYGSANPLMPIKQWRRYYVNTKRDYQDKACHGE